MDLDLEKLKAAALAATAGPWDWDNEYLPAHIAGGEVIDMEPLPYGDVYTTYDVPYDPEDPDMKEPLVIAKMVRDKDARFIRAFNPAVALELLAEIERLRAPAASGATPEGYALVPVEPTMDMMDAPDVSVGGCYSCTAQRVGLGDCKDIYKAMIAAAPIQPEPN